MNSQELGTAAGREAVHKLMFDDGVGEEALDHVEAYAISITGRASKTATAHVRRHIVSILREGAPHLLRLGDLTSVAN